jgi:hypothetical protein
LLFLAAAAAPNPCDDNGRAEHPADATSPVLYLGTVRISSCGCSYLISHHADGAADADLLVPARPRRHPLRRFHAHGAAAGFGVGNDADGLAAGAVIRLRHVSVEVMTLRPVRKK